MRLRTAALIACSTLAASPLAAQENSFIPRRQAAAIALSWTHAAFAPLVFEGREQRLGLTARYGQVGSADGGTHFTNAAVTVDFGVDSYGKTLPWRFAITGALLESDCDGCGHFWGAGLELERELVRHDLGGGAVALLFHPSAEYTISPQEVSLDALGFAVGTPLVYSARVHGLRVSPFVTPGIGYGRLTGVEFAGGDFLAMIGGGVRATTTGAHATGVLLGAQHVVVKDAHTTMGAGVTMAF